MDKTPYFWSEEYPVTEKAQAAIDGARELLPELAVFGVVFLLAVLSKLQLARFYRKVFAFGFFFGFFLLFFTSVTITDFSSAIFWR